MSTQLDVDSRNALELHLEADLRALSQFSDPGPGVTRLSWTAAYADACSWLTTRMRQAGLEVSRDPAGNLIGRLNEEAYDGGKAVAVGSHIDSVPNGGAYDGALGVLAGVRIAERLSGQRAHLRRPLWVIAFMDEEGSRFRTSMLGSRAFAGEALPSLEQTDADGVSIAEAMKAAGDDPAHVGAASSVESLDAYLELHIEQGPTLEGGGYDLGVVTALVGRRVLTVRIEGRANHAGTTPRRQRQDALRAAAELVAALHAAADRNRESTLNVGHIDSRPGAVNVVPGEATFDVEFRSAKSAGLKRTEKLVREQAKTLAQASDLDCQVSTAESVAPVSCDEQLVELLEREAEEQGAAVTRLVSGAGHDGLIIGRHVQTAMLFVPSRDGVSHAPDEHTDIEHCALGAEVLGAAVAKLAVGEEEGDV